MFLNNRFQLFFYFFIGVLFFSESLLICSQGTPEGFYHPNYGWVPKGSPLFPQQQAAQVPLVEQMPLMQQHLYGYQQDFVPFQGYYQQPQAGYQGMMPQQQQLYRDYQSPAVPYSAYQIYQQPPQPMVSQFFSPMQQSQPNASGQFLPMTHKSVVPPIPEPQKEQELVFLGGGKFFNPVTGVIYKMVNPDSTFISGNQEIDEGDPDDQLQKKVDEAEKILAAKKKLLLVEEALVESERKLLLLEREKAELKQAADDQRKQELKQKEEAAAVARREQLEEEKKQQQKLQEQCQLELQNQEKDMVRKAKEEYERKEQEEKEIREKRRLEEEVAQKKLKEEKEKREQEEKQRKEEQQALEKELQEKRRLEEIERQQKAVQAQKEKEERKKVELQKQQEAQKQKQLEQKRQEDAQRKKNEEADIRRKQQKADQERKQALQRQQEEQKRAEEEKKEQLRIKKAEKEAQKLRKEQEAEEEQARLTIKQKTEEERLKREEEYRKKKEDEKKEREKRREAARAAAALKTTVTVGVPENENTTTKKKKKKVATTDLEDQKPVEYKPFIILAHRLFNMFDLDKFKAVRDVVSGSEGMQPICPALVKSLEYFFVQNEETQEKLADYILKKHKQCFIPGLNLITGKMETYASHSWQGEYKDCVGGITDVLLYFAFIEYLKRIKTALCTDLALNYSAFTTVQNNLVGTIKQVEELLESKISAAHGVTLFPQYMESLERVYCFQVPFGFVPQFFLNKGETLIKLLAKYSTVHDLSNKQFKRLEEMVNAYTNKIGISAQKIGVVPKVAAEDGVAGYGVPGGVSVVPSEVLALQDLYLEGSPKEMAQALKSIVDGAVMAYKGFLPGNHQQPPSKITRVISADEKNGTQRLSGAADNSTEIPIVDEDGKEPIEVEADPDMLSELKDLSDLLYSKKFSVAADPDFVGVKIFQQPTDS